MNWIKNNLAIIAICIAAIVLLVLLGSINSCTNRSNEAAQAKQTEKSGAAFADAVANGVATIDNRVATEKSIDEANVKVKEEVGNAQSLDAIDAAITSSLCGDKRHRNDPACIVP